MMSNKHAEAESRVAGIRRWGERIQKTDADGEALRMEYSLMLMK